MACSDNVASESIADFIVRYYVPPAEYIASLGTDCVDFVNRQYAVVHAPLDQIPPLSLASYSYFSIPKLYSLLDSSSLEASGILPAARLPALSGGGRGVIIGFVDTGIDYTNPLFRNPDGSTRILGIWDQTVGNDSPDRAAPFQDAGSQSAEAVFRPLYGTQYTKELIDQALRSEDPFSVVPSRDENGHGTFLASVAAGGADETAGFTGAAPEASIAVVKLKPAKQYLRDFFLIREAAEAYQENDIMLGITYLVSLARRYYMPLVICLAAGTNMGSHTGRGALGLFLGELGSYRGVVVLAAAGNETGYGQHCSGTLLPGGAPHEIDLKVEGAAPGFSLEFWAGDIGFYRIGFISPTGEVVRELPVSSRVENTLRFLLEQTEITVYSQIVNFTTGSQLIFMRFQHPMPGIWRITVTSLLDVPSQFHLWLPGHAFIAESAVFLRPDPDTTVVDPANSPPLIAVTAYDHQTGGIYIHASRGYSRSGQIRPDIAAPGVNIQGAGVSIAPFTRMTGTSAAAAIAAGAAAILLRWGILEDNEPLMNTSVVKTYFIRGARRNPELTYPNREFGYGALDLYQTFLGLRS